MKVKIVFLSFKGCPNADLARRHLTDAMSQLSLPCQWTEVDVEDPSTPSSLRGFASPSILINGVDIETGLSHLEGGSSCQSGGAPETAKIIEAIQRALGSKSENGVVAFLATLPASVIAVFPSVFCPACYPAVAALLGSAGFGFFASEKVLHPLTIVFLGIALGGLFYQSRRLKSYKSFGVGLLGALGIYGGHYLFPSLLLTYGSVAILIGASIWNLINKNKILKTQGECSSCKP